MAKTYDPASEEIHARVRRMIEQYHPDLKASDARIDLLVVYADEGQTPLSCHGYPAQAVVRITNAKERALGRGDAEIVIDKSNYEALDEPKRDALLDHELYHLKVKKDRHGIIAVDDHRRPVLKMRKHDREYGWFDAIAQRHGEHSAEIMQAKALAAGLTGQLYFAFGSAQPADLHA